MRLFKQVFLVLGMLGLWGIFAGLAAQPDRYHSDRDEVLRKAEKRYLRTDTNDQVRKYNQDTVVEEGETIPDHLLVINGDLSVRGRIDGDVLVVWGDVRIYNTGRISGNVTSVGGKIKIFDNGVVRGDMLETSSRSLVDRRRMKNIFRNSYKHDRYGTIPVNGEGEDLIFKYNRVEGMFLGLQFPRNYVRNIGHFNSYGFLGYGFKSQDFRFQVGLDRWFIDPLDYRLEVGGEVHSLTDTKDSWRMPVLENTLAALLFREDFYDYFEREGYSLHVSQNATRYLRGTLEFRHDDYRELTNRVSWSLFGGDKIFRPNQPLGTDEGTMRSIYGEIIFDNRDDLEFTTTGLNVKISAEVSSEKIGGDFSFNRYLADIRYFLPVATGENISVRIMAGTSEGALPVQKNFELGGIGTLRGYEFKEFAGSSMVLMNLEYRLHSRILGTEIPFLGDYFSLILFTDVGNAWDSPSGYSFSDRLSMLRIKNLKNDVGLAIAHPRGDYRLNIAKRTDTSHNSFVVTFRISQPF